MHCAAIDAASSSRTVNNNATAAAAAAATAAATAADTVLAVAVCLYVCSALPATAAKVCMTDADCAAPQLCRVDAANPGPGQDPANPYPAVRPSRNRKCQSAVVCDTGAGAEACGATVYYDFALDSRVATPTTGCCAQGSGCYFLEPEKPSTCVKDLVCPAGETACGFGYAGGSSHPNNECCKPGVQICSGGGGGMSGGGAYSSSCANIGPA
jgi:hypothetical protein